MKQSNKIEIEQIPRRTRGCQGWGVGGLGERADGTEEHRLAVTEQSQDVKYSVGSTAGPIVTPVCGARRVLEISGGHLEKSMIF